MLLNGAFHRSPEDGAGAELKRSSRPAGRGMCQPSLTYEVCRTKRSGRTSWMSWGAWRGRRERSLLTARPSSPKSPPARFSASESKCSASRTWVSPASPGSAAGPGHNGDRSSGPERMKSNRRCENASVQGCQAGLRSPPCAIPSKGHQLLHVRDMNAGGHTLAARRRCFVASHPPQGSIFPCSARVAVNCRSC